MDFSRKRASSPLDDLLISRKGTSDQIQVSNKPLTFGVDRILAESGDNDNKRKMERCAMLSELPQLPQLQNLVTNGGGHYQTTTIGKGFDVARQGLHFTSNGLLTTCRLI